MIPIMDRNAMDCCRSSIGAEQKAPEYSFKTSTWAKMNRNYLDHDSDQRLQKTQKLFTLQRKSLALTVLLSNFPRTVVTGLQ